MQDETRVEVVQGLDAAWAWIEHLPQGDAAQEHLNAIDAAREFLLAFAAPPAGERVNLVLSDLQEAYIAGARDVHTYWSEGGELPRGDPEFGEAAMDYAKAAFDPLSSAARLQTLPHQADREAIARVREAAQSVIDNAASSYRSRGKDRYIEDESGERMMLVPHEDWAALQGALSPTPSAGRDGWEVS